MKKSLSLVSKLRRNLRMGKTCRVNFIKVGESDTLTVERWVKAIPAERIKGTGKPNPKVVCFFDIQKQDVICCRVENLLAVETEAQVKRMEMRRARYEKAMEIASFYEISVKDAWVIVLDKDMLRCYESERESDYYGSGEYVFDRADDRY